MTIENNGWRVAELQARAVRQVRDRQSELPPLPDELPSTTTTTQPSDATEESEPSVAERIHAWREASKFAELPAIEDTVDFLSRPVEQPKVLIEGVLYQGSKMILGSGSKSFKTWTLLDLAMSVACGAPWLGINTTAGKVLFLNFELKPASIGSRMNAIKTARCLHWESEKFDLWNLRGHAAEYSTVIPKILERVKTKGYDLIILDPVYKLYGDTDENSAGDVAKLMNELERLAVKTNAAIVFSAHFSKGNQAGKESVDRVSGSGVFARDPDSILSFTKHQEDNAFVVESTLRDFKQMEPFVVKWEYPLLARDEDLNPGKLKTPLTKKPSYTVDDLLKWVVQESITTKTLKEQVQEQTGMSQSLFYELTVELKKQPGVTFNADTKAWSYTAPPKPTAITA
jgi:hypothetical protein